MDQHYLAVGQGNAQTNNIWYFPRKETTCLQCHNIPDRKGRTKEGRLWYSITINKRVIIKETVNEGSMGLISKKICDSNNGWINLWTFSLLDDPSLPPSMRCKYNCDKLPTGPLDRKKLLDFINEQVIHCLLSCWIGGTHLKWPDHWLKLLMLDFRLSKPQMCQRLCPMYLELCVEKSGCHRLNLSHIPFLEMKRWNWTLT